MKKIKARLLSMFTVAFMFVNTVNYSYATYDEYSYNEYSYDDSYTQYEDSWGNEISEKQYYLNSFDYYIKNMDVSVDVNDKREYIVTETINAYFNTYKHGIIRNIPLNSSVEKTRIEDISVVGDEYQVIKYGGNIDIKIGNPNEYVIDEKTYVISYTLKHYDDGEKDADYLYLDVLGTEWDVPIENFAATIRYPENFKFMDMNFTSGSYGSTYNDGFDCKKDDNVIKIKSNTDYISPYNGATINVEFEDGSFSNVPVNVAKIVIDILNIIGVVLLIISFIKLTSSIAKVKDIPTIVEFYPPEDMNATEMSYIYDGNITNESITALIYGWASKGYIKIEVDKGKLALIKLKELESEDKYERDLFRLMFKFGKGTPTRVTESDLKYQLGSVYSSIKSDITRKYNDDERFNFNVPKAITSLKWLMIGLIIAQTIAKCNMNMYGFEDSAMIFVFILISAFLVLLSCNNEGYNKSKGFILNLFSDGRLIMLIIGVGIFWFIDRMWFYSSFMSLLLSLSYIFALFLITQVKPEKCEYQAELYGRICGFVDFIEHAEKDKLEMLIDDDPEYFYKVLPYAQALEISTVWCDKFKNIGVKPTESYSNVSDVVYINRMSRNLSRMGSTAASSPPSESSSSGRSGSFGGGGFSGGGSGGGGGSSW